MAGNRTTSPSGVVELVERAANGLGEDRVIEIQRARILAAMGEVCAIRGAANVTVAHVVESAGVSRRTFYEIFRGREECFLAAFDSGVDRAYRNVLDAYDPRSKWLDRIRASLVALLQFLDEDPVTSRLLIVESAGAGAGALERRKQVLARMIAAVEEGRGSSKAGAEVPPLAAEGVVGGALAVLQARLLDEGYQRLTDLAGSLMAMIVLPYLGPDASRRELARPLPKHSTRLHSANGNPLGRLGMRLTYRTVRVLMAIAAYPGSSNRLVADASGVTDQGQMSKLLARLLSLGLIENTAGGASRGEPNAWTLTEKGWQMQGAFAEQTASG